MMVMMVVMDNDGYDMLKLQSNATAKAEPTTLSNMELPKMKMMIGKLINNICYDSVREYQGSCRHQKCC